MLTKLRSATRELGYLSAFLYGINRLFEKSHIHAHIYRYILVAQPVPDTPLTPPGRGTAINIKVVRPDDTTLSALPSPQKAIRARFKQGAVCLAAYKKDTLIGCIWLCLGPYEEDEVRSQFLPLPAGEACWDFDVYIAPEHRFGFGFSRIWDAANDYMRKRGIRWTMSRISAFNKESIASHARLGTRRLGTATYFKFTRWQLMFCSKAPFVHLSLTEQSVPVIRLHAPK